MIWENFPCCAPKHSAHMTTADSCDHAPPQSAAVAGFRFKKKIRCAALSATTTTRAHRMDSKSRTDSWFRAGGDLEACKARAKIEVREELCLFLVKWVALK